MAAGNTLWMPSLQMGGGLAMPSWLGLMLNKIRRALLSDDEKRLLHLVEFGASTFGASLLSAENLDDLEDRLDAAVESPELGPWMALMTVSSGNRTRERATATADLAPIVSRIFGGGSEDLIRQALHLSMSTAEARPPSLRAAEPQVREALRSLTLMEQITHSSLPPEAALAALEGVKAAICGLAFCAALLDGTPLPPWLGLAIAERWVRALRHYMRLLASMPGTKVPVEFIPAEERMDLERLARESADAQARFQKLARLAQQTPGGIYPPLADPECPPSCVGGAWPRLTAGGMLSHTSPMQTGHAVEQARVLRVLAERLEGGSAELPPELESELLQALEDRLDVEAVRAARSEPGLLSWDKVKADLGL